MVRVRAMVKMRRWWHRVVAKGVKRGEIGEGCRRPQRSLLMRERGTSVISQDAACCDCNQIPHLKGRSWPGLRGNRPALVSTAVFLQASSSWALRNPVRSLPSLPLPPAQWLLYCGFLPRHLGHNGRLWAECFTYMNQVAQESLKLTPWVAERKPRRQVGNFPRGHCGETWGAGPVITTASALLQPCSSPHGPPGPSDRHRGWLRPQPAFLPNGVWGGLGQTGEEQESYLFRWFFSRKSHRLSEQGNFLVLLIFAL